MYVFAAIPKITADPMAVQGFTMMGLGTTGMYAIGFLELAGAVALLIPAAGRPGRAGFVALMVGAVTSHGDLRGRRHGGLPAVVLVLVAIVAWGRRRSTAALVDLVRS